MKERKTFINKMKQLYSQHEVAIILIVLIVAFIVGYLYSWNFLEKPLNDSQFKLCEQVVQDVYAQKGQVIVEIPEDFSVSITETTITVKTTNYQFRGKVIAKLHNGELVMTREMETDKAIGMSMIYGIVSILLTILIVLCMESIYKKIEK